MIKKVLIYLLFGFWLLILALELFVWGNLRLIFLPYVPIVEMIASLFQDTLWLPLAIALPGYLFWLACLKLHSLLSRMLAGIICFALVLWAMIDVTGCFRWLFLPLALFFIGIIHFIHRERYLPANVLFFLLACLGVVINYRTQLLPRIPFSSTPVGTLTVLDYNILTGQRGAKRAPVFDLISEEKPDIIFIQEINRYDHRLFLEKLGKLYPYQLWADRFEYYNGGVILSKIPFKSGRNVDINTRHLPGHTNVNHAVISWQGREIHLLNCHLYPSGHAFIQLTFGRRSLGSFLENTRNAFLRRLDEAQQLQVIIQQIHDPIIMAGDFNDTPNSTIYRLFSQKYQNAFAESGWGLGTTFGQYSIKGSVSPNWIFFLFDFLRIDHIFLSHDFEIKEARVLPVASSDHRPQIVRVVVK